MHQAVSVPTHMLSHFSIFRTTDVIACSTTLTLSISSDHYSASYDLFAQSPVNNAVHKYLKKVSMHFVAFNADIINKNVVTLCPSYEIF